MGIWATVVFTDLHGSTAAFEALGNARATERVTQITTRIAAHCTAHGGRVVKTLGDGVLAIFQDSVTAVDAVVDIQRMHSLAPVDADGLEMPIRVGLASGEVELVAGDCYGDAVNVASRLCDLCGPREIWANADALKEVAEGPGITFRILGPIGIRGRAEPCSVYQIEWHEDSATDQLTMQGTPDPRLVARNDDALGLQLELSRLGEMHRFKVFDLPVHIGRVRGVEFVVNDPRVSRSHVRFEWRHGSVVLVDISSYGTWLRFAGATGPDLLLRREECVLHGEGDIALGGSFADVTVPTVHFRVF